MTKCTERVHRLVKQMKTTMEGTNRRRMRDPLHVTKVQGKLALLEQLSGLNNKDLKIKSVNEMLEIVYALSTDRVKGEAVAKVSRMEKTKHSRKMESSGAASSTDMYHDKTKSIYDPTTDSTMNFGMHYGKKFSQVMAEDPIYTKWMVNSALEVTPEEWMTPEQAECLYEFAKYAMIMAGRAAYFEEEKKNEHAQNDAMDEKAGEESDAEISSNSSTEGSIDFLGPEDSA